MEQNKVFDSLVKCADYSLNSHSRDLVYETYGAAKMAYNLGAITSNHFTFLNDKLVVNGLNNPAVSKLR